MKPIILREIPKPIADQIQRQAEMNGTSLNQTVIELLAQALNVSQEHGRLYHDLDHLAGCWPAEQADPIDAELGHHRSTDAELWK